VIPAGHHSVTRSPNSAGVVYRTTGSRPSLVCTQVCVQPVLTRCGVMTHQTLTISRLRDGGQTRPAVSSASPVPAMAMSQAAPSR
jgi:hypothetical protein